MGHDAGRHDDQAALFLLSLIVIEKMNKKLEPAVVTRRLRTEFTA